ncbi:MAG: RNA polymerase sigma factor RpoH [Gammaproteobacteria bacterium]|nr:RNA polymerase sigma factor RpoH [Gammaproteobacteria bacterium]
MSQSLQLGTIGLPIGSLDAYIYQVNQISMLSLEEEVLFAKRFQNENDLESAKKLVLSHLRYVVRVAKGYLGYGLPLGDLVQEGNVGLMKAVKRFDPTMGVRLVSFAVHWIKAEIHEFIIKNWRIVKIATTKAQRKLFFKLRQQKSRLGWFTDEEVSAVATDLGVSRQEVLLMEQRLNASDVAFDIPDDAEEGGSGSSSWAPAEYLADHSMDPARVFECEQLETDSHDRLHGVLAQLDARSQDILALRWLAEKKATLHELADKYQVSAERIRQLEKQALDKLKKLMVAA